MKPIVGCEFLFVRIKDKTQGQRIPNSTFGEDQKRLP
jgi:hypothetical protein